MRKPKHLFNGPRVSRRDFERLVTRGTIAIRRGRAPRTPGVRPRLSAFAQAVAARHGV